MKRKGVMDTKKNIIFIKILILMMAVFLFGCCKTNGGEVAAKEPMKLNINEDSTIVCFGDSLTYGHGADSIETSC